MKTAMQELIDELKKISTAVSKENNLDMVAAFNYAIDLSRLIIKKEKEQIINAFEVGYKSCDLDEAFEINRKLASGELYYNQTYNQNK